MQCQQYGSRCVCKVLGRLDRVFRPAHTPSDIGWVLVCVASRYHLIDVPAVRGVIPTASDTKNSNAEYSVESFLDQSPAQAENLVENISGYLASVEHRPNSPFWVRAGVAFVARSAGSSNHPKERSSSIRCPPGNGAVQRPKFRSPGRA